MKKNSFDCEERKVLISLKGKFAKDRYYTTILIAKMDSLDIDYFNLPGFHNYSVDPGFSPGRRT